MSFDYTYSITTDFSSSFNAATFHKEIDDSAIATALENIDTSGDNVTVRFAAQLSAGAILMKVLLVL
jgi:hypothetical protein